MVKDFLRWQVKEMDKAWQKCRRGRYTIIPRNEVSRFPPELKIRKIGRRWIWGPTNKVGFFSSRKSAFEVGFSEGWGLAITSEEGYKWAKFHRDKRRRRGRGE